MPKINGQIQFPVAPIGTPIIASTTVSADVVSTTETALATISLPANTFSKPGDTVRVRLSGTITKSGFGPTHRLRVRYNGISGTVLLDTATITSTGAVTSNYWETTIEITCRTIGATGTVLPQMCYKWLATLADVLASGGATNDDGSVAAVTVDTTVASSLVFSIEYSANTAGNSKIVSNGTAELIRA